jgi:thioredoxin reductase
MVEATDVLIVGDGPTGLSAALLLEKNDLDTIVVGEDETPMHQAVLLNYLGIEEEKGTPFMQRARKQAEAFGTDLREDRVATVGRHDGGFRAETEAGDEFEGRYLVLATGTDRSLAEELALDLDGDVIAADKEGYTSEDGVFAGGWASRPYKIQAATSVGDGAAIALSILSEDAGEPVHDFDVA